MDACRDYTGIIKEHRVLRREIGGKIGECMMGDVASVIGEQFRTIPFIQGIGRDSFSRQFVCIV
jgi:hypothetical protein